MNLKASRAAAFLALLCPLAVQASQPVEVEIYDRSNGQILPVYWHGGERHVAGEPGHEYEIRIRSRSDRRVLAVTSVDGINVITGATAAPGQGGYVVDARDRIAIDGWRKSLDQVAAFYFTALPDSYAARTGRPDNVGVIGIALFCERLHMPAAEPKMDAAAPSAARKSAEAAGGFARDESRLGTGHGQRRESAAGYTRFERASDQPDEVIRIYYDSRRNLIARGIIPSPGYRMAERVPDPFPRGFVPDP
jgi:hypothetical protein